jgi:ADP-ribose pyrophosphatase YjhB (NUDIX family)
MPSEVIKVYSAGGVVLNIDGKVLIVNQGGNSWSLPKGRIEEGEDELTAAKREIHEESGVSDLQYIDRLGSYGRYVINTDGSLDMSKHKTITLFLFRTAQMELKPIDGDNPEARWVDKNEVVSYLSRTEDKDFFLSILSKL